MRRSDDDDIEIGGRVQRGSPIPRRRRWVYAPKPATCPKCGADGELHLHRIEPVTGDAADGWCCLVCGWDDFDPGLGESPPHREGRHQ
jgi:hypothetical protein